jgi:hypothetical protein
MKLSIRTGATRFALAAILAAVAACGSDSATGVTGTSAKLRIVNSVFHYTDATTSASLTAPSSIDVLIDSSTTAPGAAAIPPVSVATVTAAGSSGYQPATPDVHSFVARLAGDTGPTSTFYTNTTNNLPYLPKQYLSAGTPYTLVAAGIVPATPAGTNTLIPSDAVPFVVLTDDPFPPPQVGGVYQARFRVINAAPFTVASGLGSTLLMYLTPGTTAPTTVAGLTTSGGMLYRNASVYVNADAGTYTLTLASGGTIVAQTAITLAAGEVRSYVVQSTGYAAVPSPANQVVQSLLDNKY